MIFNCIDLGLTILSGLQRTSALSWLSVMYMQAWGKTIVGGHIRIGVACKHIVNSTVALWELLQELIHFVICIFVLFKLCCALKSYFF